MARQIKILNRKETGNEGKFHLFMGEDALVRVNETDRAIGATQTLTIGETLAGPKDITVSGAQPLRVTNGQLDALTKGQKYFYELRSDDDVLLARGNLTVTLFHPNGELSVDIDSDPSRTGVDTFIAPDAFPWDNATYPFVVTRTDGVYSVDIEPRDLVNPAIWTNPAIYVDGREGFGDDGNTGADYDNALRSIKQAFTVGNATGAPYQVVVRPGDFSESAFTQNGNVEPSQPVAIVADGGRVRYRTGEWELTWSLESGTTYTASVSSVKRMFRTDVLTDNGSYTELTAVVDLAAVNATVGTWVQDGSSIHVNIGKTPSVSDIAALRSFNGARFMTHTDDFYIEGFDIEGGISGALHLDPVASRNVVGVNSTFRYSSPNNPVQGQDACRIRRTNGLVAFFNCDASCGAKDGFNFHDDGTRQMYTLMVNCTGYDNGDGTQTSVNGFTTHEDVISAVIGGSFGHSHNGTEVHIIDTTFAWLLGTKCEARDVDGTSISFKSSQTATMWLEETVADAQGSVENYSIEANGGTVYTRDHVTISGDETTSGDGTITVY